MDKNRPGVLYVVATPIGNLGDITFRAVEVLNSSDLVAAEDTRHTARLFSRCQISTRLVSCHEHNEEQKAENLVEKIRDGADVALVSDAGTPSVSDPGYRLVTAALEAGLRVIPVPGASAAVTALSVSGLPSDRFCFVGFLPKKQKRRQEILNSLAGAEATLIFYESPRRLSGFLKTLLKHFGDRDAVVAREMTKRHEEFMRGSLSGLIQEVESRASVKGEITVLVSGKAPVDEDAAKIPEDLHGEIKAALSARDVSPSVLAAELARKYGIAKNKIYRLILDFKKERQQGEG